MYTCPLMFIICIIWAFRMSLMMEMGALALGSGAVVGGVFGMNLVSGLEEHPQGESTAIWTVWVPYKLLLHNHLFCINRLKRTSTNFCFGKSTVDFIIREKAILLL